MLESGASVRSMSFNEKEQVLVDEFQMLTAKPVLYVCNVDEGSAKDGNAYVDRVRETVKDEGAEIIILAVATESDIAELEDYDEQQIFLEDIGLEEPGAARLIRSAYKLLNLQN